MKVEIVHERGDALIATLHAHRLIAVQIKYTDEKRRACSAIWCALTRHTLRHWPCAFNTALAALDDIYKKLTHNKAGMIDVRQPGRRS